MGVRPKSWRPSYIAVKRLFWFDMDMDMWTWASGHIWTWTWTWIYKKKIYIKYNK